MTTQTGGHRLHHPLEMHHRLKWTSGGFLFARSVFRTDRCPWISSSPNRSGRRNVRCVFPLFLTKQRRCAFFHTSLAPPDKSSQSTQWSFPRTQSAAWAELGRTYPYRVLIAGTAYTVLRQEIVRCYAATCVPCVTGLLDYTCVQDTFTPW